MAIIIPANTLATGGFDVDNSLRFNDGSSDNLSRTTETPTNADKYTFSTWIKRSSLGASNMKIFGVQGANANEQNLLEFNADDLVWMQTDASGGNTVYRLRTDRKFRDPSAWYHIVVAYDSSQGTANNRIRMYINGVEETSFSTRTNPSANLDSLINSSVSATAGRTLRLGRTGDNGGQYFDGYMSEVCFIDGQQLAPTSFGEFDEDSGIWKPIDVSGLTFGTNGFYLDFEDSSNLGNDANGGTDLTATNLAATDQSTDTCTNNFATLNPLDNFYQGATFSEGNLKLVTTTTGNTTAWSTGTIGVSNGKWYWEVKVSSTGNDFDTIGFAPYIATGAGGSNILGTQTDTVGWHGATGQLRKSDSVLATLSTYSTGDILSFALDLDNNLIFVYKNGSIQNSGTGLAITAPASTSTGIYLIAAGTNDNAAGTYELNFGSPSFAISSGNADGNGYGNFEYAVPIGYFAINTKNLAEYG